MRSVHGNVVSNVEDKANWVGLESFKKGTGDWGEDFSIVFAGFKSLTAFFKEAADANDLISEGVAGEVSNKGFDVSSEGDDFTEASADLRATDGLVAADGAEEGSEVFSGELFNVEGDVEAVVELWDREGLGSDNTEEDLGRHTLGSSSSFEVTGNDVVDFDGDLLDDLSVVLFEVLLHGLSKVGGVVGSVLVDVGTGINSVRVAGIFGISLELFVQSAETREDGDEVLSFEELNKVVEASLESVEAGDSILFDLFGGKAVLLGFTDTEGGDVEGGVGSQSKEG